MVGEGEGEGEEEFGVLLSRRLPPFVGPGDGVDIPVVEGNEAADATLASDVRPRLLFPLGLLLALGFVLLDEDLDEAVGTYPGMCLCSVVVVVVMQMV